MADEKHGASHRDTAPAPMRSGVEGLEWPPILTGRAAVLAAFLHQLEQTQWLSARDVRARQSEQLALLVHHAARYSPQFQDRLARAGLKPDDIATPESLTRLPLLTRRDIQAAGGSFYCTELPSDHMPLSKTGTSGSTGEPVVTLRSEATGLVWRAMTMRDHLWHRRDFTTRLAAVRADVKQPVRLEDWGAPASLLYHTGPSIGIPGTMDIGELAQVLARFKPGILIIYPGVLAALTRHCRAAGPPPLALGHIRTIGETLTAAARDDAASYWGARIEDAYSSQEFGYIALQCPDSGLYHAMAESHLVEVVDAQGEPCGEGEIGRVIVTDLHNFATPLIRYEIGDHAERGGPCPCGRGLQPVLRRIVGRERNLILMPDGTRHWPQVGFKWFREVAPISQYQFIQTGREEIEVRLVAERPVTAAEEEALRTVITTALGFPFRLGFTYWQGRLPPNAGGKFEEFVCRVSAAGT